MTTSNRIARKGRKYVEAFDPPLKDVGHQAEFNTPRAVLEELVSLYDDARTNGEDRITTKVGAKFESRVRIALASLPEED